MATFNPILQRPHSATIYQTQDPMFAKFPRRAIVSSVLQTLELKQIRNDKENLGWQGGENVRSEQVSAELQNVKLETKVNLKKNI